MPFKGEQISFFLFFLEGNRDHFKQRNEMI